MKNDEYIEELYNCVVGISNQKGVDMNKENREREKELDNMISSAMNEKYGEEKTHSIMNEKNDIECDREHLYHIAKFKVAIKFGFMLANLLNESVDS